MTQTQHTPGPWILAPEKYQGQYVIHIDKPQGDENMATFIALVLDAGEPMTTYISNEEEARANAHLIAAAPETAAERDRLKAVNAQLLDPLKAALAPFDNNQTRNPDGFSVGEPSWVSQARAAIKATTE